jgi:hypothetical protein
MWRPRRNGRRARQRWRRRAVGAVMWRLGVRCEVHSEWDRRPPWRTPMGRYRRCVARLGCQWRLRRFLPGWRSQNGRGHRPGKGRRRHRAPWTAGAKRRATGHCMCTIARFPPPPSPPTSLSHPRRISTALPHPPRTPGAREEPSQRPRRASSPRRSSLSRGSPTRRLSRARAHASHCRSGGRRVRGAVGERRGEGEEGGAAEKPYESPWMPVVRASAVGLASSIVPSTRRAFSRNI